MDNYKAFLESVVQGCVGGYVSEWPQLRPACSWALQQVEENARLREALCQVRVKAIPAGASVMNKNHDWQDRCNEVLDIIDNAIRQRAGIEGDKS